MLTNSTSASVSPFCESVVAALQKPNVHTLLVNEGMLAVDTEINMTYHNRFKHNSRMGSSDWMETVDIPSGLEEADIKIIAPILAVHTSLTRLHLDLQEFGDSGVEAIAEALKSNSVLTSLNLSSNTGIKALIAALKINTCLVSLIVNDYKSLTFDSFESILAFLESNSTMTCISFNVAGADLKPRISQLAQCLRINSTLRDLLLPEHTLSYLSTKDISTLGSSLTMNPSISRLYVPKERDEMFKVKAKFDPIQPILDRNAHNFAQRSLTLFQALWVVLSKNL